MDKKEKKLADKNIKLMIKFDKYLNKYPRTYNKFPEKGGILIHTIKGDDEFNEYVFGMIARYKNKKRRVIEARWEGKRWRVIPPVKV